MEHAETSQEGGEGSSGNSQGTAEESTSSPATPEMETGGRALSQGDWASTGGRRQSGHGGNPERETNISA